MVKEIKYNRTVGRFRNYLNNYDKIINTHGIYYMCDIGGGHSMYLYYYDIDRKRLLIHYADFIKYVKQSHNPQFSSIEKNIIVDSIIDRFSDDVKLNITEFDVYIHTDHTNRPEKYNEHL